MNNKVYSSKKKLYSTKWVDGYRCNTCGFEGTNKLLEKSLLYPSCPICGSTFESGIELIGKLYFETYIGKEIIN